MRLVHGQHAANQDMRAVQLKLNELIAAVEGASNRLIDVEDLTEQEAAELYRRYCELAREAKSGKAGAKLSVDAQSSKTGIRGKKQA